MFLQTSSSIIFLVLICTRIFSLLFLVFWGFFNKASVALLANYIELNNTAIFIVSSSEVFSFPSARSQRPVLYSRRHVVDSVLAIFHVKPYSNGNCKRLCGLCSQLKEKTSAVGS